MALWRFRGLWPWLGGLPGQGPAQGAAEPGARLLLGCRALEGLNLRVDSRRKKLVAAGPVIAATAIKPVNDAPRAGGSSAPC
jgi:hypothetical protein